MGVTRHTRFLKTWFEISTHADDQEWNQVLANSFSKIGSEKMYSYVNAGSRSMMMDPKPGRVIANWVKSIPLEQAGVTQIKNYGRIC